tara:strand:+ start:25660 stop:26049 length:390 start_codon:yes stop_codon:yes gene_type:complete
VEGFKEFSYKILSWVLFDYHFYKNEFEKALEYLKKFKTNEYYYCKARVYAKKGAIKNTYEALNYVPEYQYKAVVFANLKEKDSTYYYLNKMTSIGRITTVNGMPEFSPFRKELIYQAFLKKNYFPVLNN